MDSRKQRKVLFLNMGLAALLVSLVLFVMEVSGAATVPSLGDTGSGFDLFSKVYTRVLNSYYRDTDPWDLSKDAVRGILKNLDPYSDFFDPRDFKQLQDDTRGAFGGIGIEIGVNPDKDYPQVMAYPISETPAEKAGMRAGDLIIEIDGMSTKGLDINEVVGKLRGKEGTQVKIKVRRGSNPEPMEMTLTRAKIELFNVLWSGEIQEGIGYIKLARFNAE
ncbi:MAG: S41 family peptidase, partial [Candidatus Latescibacterota bacterium]